MWYYGYDFKISLYHLENKYLSIKCHHVSDLLYITQQERTTDAAKCEFLKLGNRYVEFHYVILSTTVHI